MRQLAAIFCYLLAGLFLIGFGVMTFIPVPPDAGTLGPMGVMALFALAPLLIGALISPGSRIREIGIVLLVSGVFVGLGAAMMALVIFSPGFRALMPPDAEKDLAVFGSPYFGIAFTIAMIVAGFMMLLRGPYRRPPA